MILQGKHLKEGRAPRTKTSVASKMHFHHPTLNPRQTVAYPPYNPFQAFYTAEFLNLAMAMTLLIIVSGLLGNRAFWLVDVTGVSPAFGEWSVLIGRCGGLYTRLWRMEHSNWSMRRVVLQALENGSL